jgi:hypothetical protein
MMTLTETVRAAISDCCATELSRETRLGNANQVDFSGRSTSLGEIRVEFERRREDPVNNVVKAWRQAVENPTESPFTLVHVFSGFYLSKKPKVENARFIGNMMNKWAASQDRPIEYVAVLLDFEPQMGDADPIIDDSVGQTIAAQLRRELDSWFGSRAMTTGGSALRSSPGPA